MLLCSSQAATAICQAMEEEASSSSPSPSLSSSALLLGGGGGSGRAIDRHNPIIKDSKRCISKALPPCVDAQPPLTPRLHKFLLHRKIKNVFAGELASDGGKKTEKPITGKDKSNDGKLKSGITAARRSWSCVRPSEFSSPANSTRFLLSNDKVLSDFEPTRKLFLDEKPKEAVKALDSSLCVSAEPDQVVVLRVFLDCRGCEKKMRKHISRMQGVTSFDIDFAAKKVTVTGKLTPLEVFSSISKVKKAQVWPPSEVLIGNASRFMNVSDVKK